MEKPSPHTFKVAFRVDASLSMGTGHVMRCLTLANALSSEGAECCFLTREHPGNLNAQIRNQGHCVHSLEEPSTAATDCCSKEQTTSLTVERNSSRLAHSEWLGASQEQDIEACLPILEKTSPDWLIIDHYGIDSRWEKMARPTTQNVMVIDDLADREHDCDLLLDQNWFQGSLSARYRHKIPTHCKTLLGPAYALLSPEYAKLSASLPRKDGTVSKILVFLGGSDPSNQTLKVLKALESPALQHLSVEMVIGRNHPDSRGIRHKSRARPLTKVHQGLPSLAYLMAEADLMIGAGGATTWEKMCMGLPSLVIGIADNQIDTNIALANAGYIDYLGFMDGVTVDDIEAAVCKSIDNPGKLRAQSALGTELSNGKGALMVCQQLFS